jgi:integrating conjugative element protein (TIGR03758 family)
MTAEQNVAFTAATGGVSPALMLTAIAGIVLTLAFTWSAWVAYGAYRAWGEGAIAFYDLIWALICDEGLYEILELKLLRVGDLESFQLVLPGLLAMDPDE